MSVSSDVEMIRLPEKQLTREKETMGDISYWSERFSVISNMGSLLRNTLLAVDACGGKVQSLAKVVHGTMIGSGIAMIVSGAKISYRSVVQLGKDYKNGDLALGARHLCELLMGVSLGVFGTLFLLAGIGSITALVGVIAMGMTVAAPIFFGLFLASSLVNHYEAMKFREEFDEIVNNIPDHPNGFKTWLDLQMFDSQKVARLKENVGEDVYRMLQQLLLDKFPVDQQNSVIREVRCANLRYMAKQKVGCYIATLGLTVSLLAFAGGPVAPAVIAIVTPIVFALSAVLWEYLDSREINQGFDRYMGRESKVNIEPMPPGLVGSVCNLTSMS